MRDQNQLEFDFKAMTPEAKLDAEVAVRQQAMKVRTYVYSCANGHKAWADLNKPSHQELLLYRDYLEANRQDTGHYYWDELQRLISSNTPRIIQVDKSARQILMEEEKRAGVHKTCLATR